MLEKTERRWHYQIIRSLYGLGIILSKMRRMAILLTAGHISGLDKCTQLGATERYYKFHLEQFTSKLKERKLHFLKEKHVTSDVPVPGCMGEHTSASYLVYMYLPS